MCLTLHGGTSLSATIHGIFEVLRGDTLKHAVFYQNKLAPTTRLRPHVVSAPSPRRPIVLHNDRFGAGAPAWASGGTVPGWDFGQPQAATSDNEPRGNALVIPLLGAFDSIELIDLSRNKQCLRDIAKTFEPRGRGASKGFDFLGGERTLGRVQVLEYDIYTIVIAERASDIPQAVQQVPANKRPPLSQEVFDSLDKGYASPIAVCCFDPTAAGDAAPVGFLYTPFRPDFMFLYTLDGHDGKAPDLNARITLDHTLFVGSHTHGMMSGIGSVIDYTEPVPRDLEGILLGRAMGCRVTDTYLNGDFVFRTEDVRKGLFNGVRTVPPGFAKEFSTRTPIYLNLR